MGVSILQLGRLEHAVDVMMVDLVENFLRVLNKGRGVEVLLASDVSAHVLAVALVFFPVLLVFLVFLSLLVLSILGLLGLLALFLFLLSLFLHLCLLLGLLGSGLLGGCCLLSFVFISFFGLLRLFTFAFLGVGEGVRLSHDLWVDRVLGQVVVGRVELSLGQLIARSHS